MFWVDRLVEEIKRVKVQTIEAGRPLIIRDEKTASGRAHLGSLRGVAIHGIISEALREANIPNEYLFEINDFDFLDSVPSYLDKEKFSPYLGKLLLDVPSPDGRAKNYAEYFAQEFAEAIEKTAFKPSYYRSSTFYREGKFNEAIKKALDKVELIKKIYKEVSGSVKKDWFPLSVICEKCGKASTTKVTNWDGEKVEYLCGDNVPWAKGCGGRGKISPFDGRAKLSWKVEWAAKFKVLGVDVEGAGKDHYTKGGARDVADRICREVFYYPPPFNIPYEFFQEGGKKMSSSKSIGSGALEVAKVLPTEILRLFLLQKEPQRVIEFDLESDAVPVLFDTHDSLAENFFSGKEDDYARLFRLIHTAQSKESLKKKFLPRFSLVSFLAQMTHVDLMSEMARLKGGVLTAEEKKEIEKRKEYALLWLSLYAPDRYKFEIQKVLPEAGKVLKPVQKEALGKVLDFVETSKASDGQAFHNRLHEIKSELSIDPQELFCALYLVFLGKNHGPKAGWFLSVLDREFLMTRLKEAISKN
ncbi:MAG: lysyl-tRNA synthetase [Parcubacteria group bacterium Gr01-1014_107]|nr:MAG: lysyl-tRNA synthetase [Parcubacteria group bacterium Gr01-1014_107]